MLHEQIYRKNFLFSPSVANLSRQPPMSLKTVRRQTHRHIMSSLLPLQFCLPGEEERQPNQAERRRPFHGLIADPEPEHIGFMRLHILNGLTGTCEQRDGLHAPTLVSANRTSMTGVTLSAYYHDPCIKWLQCEASGQALMKSFGSQFTASCTRDAMAFKADGLASSVSGRSAVA